MASATERKRDGMTAMSRKIFYTIFMVTVVTMLVCALLISAVLYRSFDSAARQQLHNETIYISQALPYTNDRIAYLSELDVDDVRITWIATDGEVLYDSTTDSETSGNADGTASGNSDDNQLENHLDRPEVIAAFENGTGEASRYSDTLGEITIYYAALLEDGTVLRLSSVQSSVFGVMQAMILPCLTILLLTAIASALVANSMAKRIVRPLNNLSLDDPLSNESYDELAPLLQRMAQQHRRIESQMEELSLKQREFNTVTDNMREGFVLMDKNGMILSLNKSACQLFGKTATACTGNYILALNRSAQLQTALDAALRGISSEETLEISERVYQLMTSPVIVDTRLSGIAMIVLDVTEKHSAEMMRRDFSANVSHELKTPLTVISGYAELLKAGVAKPEDTQHFAELIYDETQHLIGLVEDILTLSRLDERGAGSTAAGEKEFVNLYAVATDVCLRLAPHATEHGVTLQLEGSDRVRDGAAMVYGTRSILNEMIYNLCENAIRYNRPDGQVTIKVDDSDQLTILSVTDTGLGIPLEYHEKIFERFFRIDKSRSKETGGTGLGLAIVKHGALYHNAVIEVASVEGSGTTITLKFPKG